MRGANLTIKQSHRANNPMNRMRQRAGLVLAVVCLTGGLALPGYCWNQPFSSQSTIAPASSSAWTNTGNLNEERYSHTATLLLNGKVLVAGGLSYGEWGSNVAELYDPDTEVWSVTGYPNTDRALFTATLLANGKVLVVGGSTSYFDVAFATTELYDPQTGTWSYTGKLNAARVSHTATMLPDGKVLVAGGFSGGPRGSYLTSAELYDPDTGTWSYAGHLNTERGEHTATLLPDGKVLVAGGTRDGDLWDTLASAEVYDPSTGTWSITGSLRKSRMLHTATLLADGKVLVSSGEGGKFDGYNQFFSAELYDPAKGEWSDTNTLKVARAGHTATPLPGGKVLVAGGGYTFSGNPLKESVFSSAELYDPDQRTWFSTDGLNTGRSQHTATLLQNGKILFTGGRNITGATERILNSAELYDPAVISVVKITGASVDGKKLYVVGENFGPGAMILLNGEQQKTRNDDANPKTTLIGKKAGRKINPGDRLQVRNPDGALSAEFTFSGL